MIDIPAHSSPCVSFCASHPQVFATSTLLNLLMRPKMPTEVVMASSWIGASGGKCFRRIVLPKNRSYNKNIHYWLAGPIGTECMQAYAPCCNLRQPWVSLLCERYLYHTVLRDTLGVGSLTEAVKSAHTSAQVIIRCIVLCL